MECINSQFDVQYFLNRGHAIAQLVTCFSTEAGVYSQGSSCGIYGKQDCHWDRFFFIPLMLQIAHIMEVVDSGSASGCSSTETYSPSHQKKKPLSGLVFVYPNLAVFVFVK
jgi:hypothetical protein